MEGCSASDDMAGAMDVVRVESVTIAETVDRSNALEPRVTSELDGAPPTSKVAQADKPGESTVHKRKASPPDCDTGAGPANEGPAPSASQPAQDTGEVTYSLVSFDGMQLKISKSAAMKSGTLKNMLCDLGDMMDDTPIPITNVEGDILGVCVKALEYYATPEGSALTHEDVLSPAVTAKIQQKKKPYTETEESLFPENWTAAGRMSTILAFNFLDVPRALDVVARRIAVHLQSLTPDEISEEYEVERDFTEAELVQLAKENVWVEEKPGD